jgi:hypothetical protein
MPRLDDHTRLLLHSPACGSRGIVRRAKTEGRIRLQWQSVVITGGSRGLALMLARQLGGMGAHETLMARDEHELRSGSTTSADVLIVRETSASVSGRRSR